MDFGELGLVNNIDAPLRWGKFWTNKLGEFFVTPLPDLMKSTGIHISHHRGDHVHIKSDKLGIHQDIDYESLVNRFGTIDQHMIRPPTQGQPAKIFLINIDYFLNRSTSITPKKIYLDTNLLSRSTTEIEIPDTSHLSDRMNALRDMGYAKVGDLALIHALDTNEISFYAYPRIDPFANRRNSDFITLGSELLQSDSVDINVEMIRKMIPFIQPLLDPMLEVMRKTSSSWSTSSPRLNMFKTLSIKPAHNYKLI
jgi:hypothetical protein